MNCRFCNSNLEHVFIDLGEAPPSNSFLNKEDLNKAELVYPLKVFVCEKCFLVQLDEFKKATDIFSEEYVYFSSMSKSWLAHASAYTNKMISEYGINKDALVVEVASNDGYLLQYFAEKDIPVLGIEPTESTAKASKEKGINTIIEFFGEELAKKLVADNKKADLLLGNNVLAHVPDINDFVKGIQIILKENGIATMEFPHLLQLIAHNQFDTIYHEHFSYLSFTTVSKIFKQQGLELFHVEEIPTHGGSLRIFAKHIEDNTKTTSNNVGQLIQKEKAAGIETLALYNNFGEKADEIKNDFIAFLKDCKQNNKKVIGYGAAAKGNTLLNYAGIKNDLIEYVVDAAPSKQNKYLPGSHIPVVKEDNIKETKPDFIIIFPWNIKDEIMSQLSYVKDWDAKFVIFIPQLQIF